MTEVVDHEARRLAEKALNIVEAHEKFCEERGRKAEAAELEMKAAVANLTEKFDNGVRRIHQRIDEDYAERSETRTKYVAELAELKTRQTVIWGIMVGAAGLISALVSTVIPMVVK